MAVRHRAGAIEGGRFGWTGVWAHADRSTARKMCGRGLGIARLEARFKLFGEFWDDIG